MGLSKKIFFIIFLIFDSFLFPSPVLALETKISSKKGVGLSISIGYCRNSADPSGCLARLKNGLQQLGVTWFYNWTANPIFDVFGDAFQFVPMIWGAGSNADRSYTQQELDNFAAIARNHPGSYWLIWNEPNLEGQANIPVAVAAKIYKPLREAIKTADPNTKMIIGGTSDPVVWTNWARDFRTNYYNLYGSNPQYEGWHGHLYICYDEYYDPAAWRSKITGFRNWINANGGGEFWLTEFGCLNYWGNVYKIIVDQFDWMETYPGIQRHAWFSAGPNQNYDHGNLFVNMPDSSTFGLSSLGQTFAQYPRNPLPTPTPTLPSCPNGNLGNLDCDSGARIDESDLSILLGHWAPFGPVPTPLPGQYSADLNGDGNVDSSDLSILLLNWKTN